MELREPQSDRWRRVIMASIAFIVAIAAASLYLRMSERRGAPGCAQAYAAARTAADTALVDVQRADAEGGRRAALVAVRRRAASAVSRGGSPSADPAIERVGPPSTHGMVYQSTPSVTPESNRPRMWGCWSRAAMAISRWKRSAPSAGAISGASPSARRGGRLEILGEIDGRHAPAPELMLEVVAIGQGVLETLELVHVSAPRGAGNSYFAGAWGVSRTPRGEVRLSGNPIRRSTLWKRGSWRTGT